MKRLKILFYWLSQNKNHVSLTEIIYQTFFRASAQVRAHKWIKSIQERDSFYEVSFKEKPYLFYWPTSCPKETISMVVCETFDENDWHYYQKEHTEVTPSEILLDVGAAEGLFSLSVIDLCKHVILIEPNQLFVAALKKTFESNIDKIEIFNVAAGNEEGVVEFNSDSFNSRVSAAPSEENEKVKLTRIDSLGIEKITYLKADVEGFEYDMLKGAEKTIRRDKPKIAITSYHTENNAEEIIKLLLDYVPEYKFFYKGVGVNSGKPVMIHFWI